MRIDILGSPLDIMPRQGTISYLEKILNNKTGSCHALALNGIKIMLARRDPEWRDLMLKADMFYADTVSVTWAARLLHGVKVDRLPGVDLMIDIMKIANKDRLRMFILGAQQESLSRALDQIKRMFPDAIVAGARNGYFGNDDVDSLLEQIRTAKPDILIVAMGHKRQEHWIEYIRNEYPIKVCMGVGGSLDALSGTLPRSALATKLGLEWLYRLMRQPYRVMRMTDIPKFVWLVLRQKFKADKFL